MKWIKPATAFIISLGMFVPFCACAGEIVLEMSGSLEYPGKMGLSIEGKSLENLCFLGIQAKGYVDRDFLNELSVFGIPSGDYQISGALPEERWPSSSFTQNGALRLKPVAGNAKGIAVHGRDFYTLSQKMTAKTPMVRLLSRQLFDRLRSHWGGLRLSNWDMNRLFDFYSRTTHSVGQWQVKVQAVPLETIKPKCEPLKTKRKP